jgi:hypothetical protein
MIGSLNVGEDEVRSEHDVGADSKGNSQTVRGGGGGRKVFGEAVSAPPSLQLSTHTNAGTHVRSLSSSTTSRERERGREIERGRGRERERERQRGREREREANVSQLRAATREPAPQREAWV